MALFGAGDPDHFGSLGRAALTLFQVVTMEGWTELMHAQFTAYPGRFVPVTYFLTFILVGTMIILNLFIGVIVNGMDEARQEMADEERERNVAEKGRASVNDDVSTLRARLAEMQDGLAALERRLRDRD